MVCAIGGLPKCPKFTCSVVTLLEAVGYCWFLMIFHYKSMVSWSYNHCHIHQWCLLWGVFSNVPNSRQFIICLYLGNLNKILLPINTVYTVSLFNLHNRHSLHSVHSRHSLYNLYKWTVRIFESIIQAFVYIFCTRPKSCFGGLIEQSGYLVFDDGPVFWDSSIFDGL